MNCPYCKHRENKVIDSRSTDNESAIRRRRECLKCKHRFTTYEQIEKFTFFVIKKDGRQELFNRSKIKEGLLRAFQKRPISIEKIDKLIDETVQDITLGPENKISSKIVGEIISKKIRDIDPVAYIRFASVYKQFSDIDSFINELNTFKQKNI